MIKNETLEITCRWLGSVMNVDLSQVNSLTDPLYVDTLKQFQKQHGLIADGIFGPITFAALDLARNPKPKLVKGLPATEFKGGYDHHILRNDAAELYKLLLDEVNSLGGMITSAGSFRSLGAAKSDGRSSTSTHYLSVAFDLHTGTGMIQPETDPYVIERSGYINNRPTWTVWCRASKGEEITIEHPITYYDRKGETTKPVTDKFINFTELAAKYGFESVPAWSSFEDPKASLLRAEWWHFQNRFCLMPEYSSFYNELLKLYTPGSLRRYGFFDIKQVWKKTWFG